MFARKPKMASEWASKTPKGAKLPEHVKRKKKPRVGVDNKMKGSYGETIIQKGKRPVVKINVKKHKGDKAELADTIKHEMYHAKHPKATEKETYKAMPKEISRAEQDRLIAKLRMKKLNYRGGAVKRKLHLGRVDTKPGELISKARAMSPKKRVAFMGLI